MGFRPSPPPPPLFCKNKNKLNKKLFNKSNGAKKDPHTLKNLLCGPCLIFALSYKVVKVFFLCIVRVIVGTVCRYPIYLNVSNFKQASGIEHVRLSEVIFPYSVS